MSKLGAVPIALLLVTVGGAQAQVPVSLELRGGAALPTADLGDATLDGGGGFGAFIAYRLRQHIDAYAGWEWHHFTTDKPFAGGDYDVEDTGYSFGLELRHPALLPFGLWARAGGIYNHVVLEDANGDVVADSGHELGWEAGGGAWVPLTQQLALMTGVRYRTFSATLNPGAGHVPVDLSYVAAELGVTWMFGGRTMAASRAR